MAAQSSRAALLPVLEYLLTALCPTAYCTHSSAALPSSPLQLRAPLLRSPTAAHCIPCSLPHCPVYPQHCSLLPSSLKAVFPTAHFNPAASSTAYLTPTALHSTAHPTGSTLSLCPSPPKLLPIAHFTGSAVCQLPTSPISLSSEWLRDNTAPHFLPPRSTAPLNVLTAGT